MTVRTQAHHPTPGAIIPSAGLEQNFVELYDLQDGGIDGTNMDLTAAFAWTGTHSFAGQVSFDTNLLFIDQTNNRIYEGATATTTIDSKNYQHQITALSTNTATFALISNATSSLGVEEARWHNSPTPANGDDVWQLRIYGNNNAAAIKEYAKITSQVDDVTAASEDARLFVSVMKAGTLTSTFHIYGDQVQVRPESLVVGGSTNIGLDGTAEGIYVKTSLLSMAQFESTDSSSSGMNVDFYKNSSSPVNGDDLTTLRFIGENNAADAIVYASIKSQAAGVTALSENGQLTFFAMANGSSVDFLDAIGSASGLVQVSLEGYWNLASTATTQDAFAIVASSITTASAFRVYSNSPDSSVRNVAEFINDNTSADAATVVFVQQDGAQEAVLIEMTGADSGLEITHTGSAGVGMLIDRTLNSASDVAIYSASGSNSGAGGLIAYSGSALSAATDYFMSFDADNTDPTGGGGAATGRVRALIGGALRYLAYY